MHHTHRLGTCATYSRSRTGITQAFLCPSERRLSVPGHNPQPHESPAALLRERRGQSLRNAASVSPRFGRVAPSARAHLAGFLRTCCRHTRTGLAGAEREERCAVCACKRTCVLVRVAVLGQPRLAAREQAVNHSRVGHAAVLLELVADARQLRTSLSECAARRTHAGALDASRRAGAYLGVEDVTVDTPGEDGAQALSAERRGLVPKRGTAPRRARAAPALSSEAPVQCDSARVALERGHVWSRRQQAGTPAPHSETQQRVHRRTGASG